MSKAIFKFNDGNKALLCSECSTIIKTGKDFTDEENKAFKGEVEMKERYCYKHIVYNYPTNSRYGFNFEEVEDILNMFPDINMKYFDDALMGNTCMMDGGHMIQYHCDIDTALRCGIEDRKQTMYEWD